MTADRETRDDCDATAAFASPPCFMHELEYFRDMSGAEVLRFLNELLEGERAGVQGIVELSARTSAPAARMALKQVAGDEARSCAMLTRHIRRLGGSPSEKTGAFLEKLRAAASAEAGVALVNRGQGWVVRRIRESLPKIGDAALRRDLEDMSRKHGLNIERCDKLEV